MPEIVKEMLIRAPLPDAWALISDMERFSLCIPGCKKVSKVSDTEFDWDLETRVMRTTRKAKARTRTLEMRSPTHAAFEGEGRLFERSNHYRLTIRGATDLEAVDDAVTRIRFAGDVSASGVGGAVIEKVAAGQMDDLFDEFERNLRSALGDDGEAPDPDIRTLEPEVRTAEPDRIRSSGWLVWAVAGAAALALMAWLLSR